VKMGIIAEDHSDVAVVSEITRKLIRPRKLGFKSFVGNGCGKLRRKCAAWASNLVYQGCNWVLIIHDLDANDEEELRTKLTDSIQDCGAETTIVLIPKHEIEAWLMYDAAAIAAAFRESTKLPLPGNPESIRDPKKYLSELIKRKYRKTYLNTVHNTLIARHIDVSHLRQSRSFSPHFGFAANVKAAFV
jgi:hypothetical protein